ncbi:MAG: hypothetical protein R3305_07465, partial [Gammaproteobacteria bacterium]|nr:hypothetical protein [Gammaproteobacteria bacterium]
MSPTAVRLGIYAFTATIVVVAIVMLVRDDGPTVSEGGVEAPADAAGTSSPGSGGGAGAARVTGGQSGSDAAASAGADLDEVGAGSTTVGAARPGTSPIPIPSDFAAEFERNEGLRDFHARLESEPEDPIWANRIEGFLESHFNATLDPAQYRILSLECRATACEILATGYGDDASRGWWQSVSEL